ncbi:fimbrillin family protein [Prevotella sp.]|uniref:fimbrillin family protein n=1 Tax=Prevotella sp. TaxID=59823 RepID=UPI003DA5D4BE
MKIKGYLFLALALTTSAVLSSCSSDEDTAQDNSLKEIKLGVSWGNTNTRANIAEAYRNIITQGQQIAVWADMINATDLSVSNYFNAWFLKSNGDNTLGYVTESKMFPAANKLNLYCMHGDFNAGQITEKTTSFPSTGLAFKVETEQVGTGNYYTSDLLYSMRKEVMPTESEIELPFYHMLSQVRILVVAGAEVSLDNLAKSSVQIVGAKYQGTFIPDSTLTDLSNQSKRAAMVVTDNTQTSNISVKRSDISAFQTDTDLASAIMLPQTFAAGTGMVKITLPNNDEFTYKPSADLKIESGKAYLIKITINDGRAQGVVTSLKDWTSTETAETLDFERSL